VRLDVSMERLFAAPVERVWLGAPMGPMSR
jgi:hypothetical protein